MARLDFAGVKYCLHILCHLMIGNWVFCEDLRQARWTGDEYNLVVDSLSHVINHSQQNVAAVIFKTYGNVFPMSLTP